MGATFADAVALGSSARSAATPSAALRVGMTWTGRSASCADLSRGHDDVRVVGQDEDLVAGEGQDRLEELPGARVGRLPAADDRRDTERLEDRGEAVAARHGYDRDRDARPRTRAAAGPHDHGGLSVVAIAREAGGRLGPAGSPALRRDSGEVVVPAAMDGAGPRREPCHGGGTATARLHVARLPVEVLDADPAQGPEREAVPDDLVRALVVDVHLDGPRVACDEDGLADRPRGGSRIASTSSDVPGPCLEEEHRLVAEPLVRVGDDGARPSPERARRLRDPRGLAGHVAVRALQDAEETRPARVDDARLAKDRQERRRPGEGVDRRPRPSRPGPRRYRSPARPWRPPRPPPPGRP